MLADALIEALIGAEFGKNDYTSPNTNHYFGILTSLPTDSDGSGGTEMSYTDYGRIEKANDGTTWPAIVAGSRKLLCGVVLTWPECGSAGSGQTLGIGVWTASSGGNPIAVAKVAVPENLSTGNVYSIAANQLEFEAPGLELLD